MPNGDPLPECPECEQKIILNGDVAARVLDATCERIEDFVNRRGKKFPNALKLVRMANKLEDDAFKFSREVMQQIGFDSEWPHSMDQS